MERIQRAGQQLRWILGSLLVLAPFLYAGLLLVDRPLALLRIPETATVDLAGADALKLGMVALLQAPTPLIYWLAFYLVFRLAGRYAEGEVFSTPAVEELRRIGLLLMATDFVQMLQTAATGPVLAGLGPTSGFLTIELKLGMSVVGLFIVLIGRIMVLAAELDEQARLTI